MTNPVYRYKIYKNNEASFAQSVCQLLTLVNEQANGLPVRLVFFGNPSSNEEYVMQSSLIARNIESFFPARIPAWSYVSQPPLDTHVVLEVTYLENADQFEVLYKQEEDTEYLLVQSDCYKEMILGGVVCNPVDHTIREQCKYVFGVIHKILAKENMSASCIVRQWNYIEKITEFDGDYQHYQCFNDIRTHFYSKYDWAQGYPAATGIGTTFGGIMVELNVVVAPEMLVLPLDNKLQIPAHDYSQRVLLGVEDRYLKAKTTPKFERGKFLSGSTSSFSYISGTAAIRGEMSQVSNDVLVQTKTTLSNIAYLVSLDNLSATNVSNLQGVRGVEYPLFRAYIKNKKDVDEVKKYMEDQYQSTEISYLYADVCREELLIEIEGIASYL